MIKEALGDRFLLSSVGLFLVASLLFGYFVYEDSGFGLAFGLHLSEPVKSRAIAIAMNDSWVQHEIYSVCTFNNPDPGPPKLIYHVKDVLNPSTFYEVGRKFDSNRTLPVVRIVVGNDSEKGTNILAFVDLVQNRVEYIGHVKRADANGQVPPEDYFNISIPWTGYHEGQNLSEEQKAKAIRLALENKTVQELMGERKYTVYDDVAVKSGGVRRGDSSYVGTYPHITFTQGTPQDQPDFLVFVVVDVDRNKVLDSMIGIRTPVFNTPANNG